MVGGFLVGTVIGRWWALFAAVALGVWVGLVSEVEVDPSWALGAAYAILAGAGIAAGVFVRKASERQIRRR